MKRSLASRPILSSGRFIAVSAALLLTAAPAPAQFRQLRQLFGPLQGGAEKPAAAAPQEIGVAIADVVPGDHEDHEHVAPESVGPLSDFATVLSTAAKIEVTNDRLTVGEFAAANDFQQSMYSNSHLFGGGGTSSSSSGSNWTMSFNWQWLKGRAEYNWGDESRLVIDAAEQSGTFRHLHYEVAEENQIDFRIWSPSIPEFLRLRQDGKDSLSIVFVSREDQVHAKGTTLSQTLKRLPAAARPKLLKLLRDTGFPLPPTPYDSTVVAGVLDELCRTLNAEEDKAFRQLAAGFDNDDYEQRKATSLEVEDQFGKWQQHIAAALNDDTFSLEARSSLRSIYQRKAEGDRARVADVVGSLDLKENPDYLVWLLAQTEDSDQQQRIFEELSRVTDESFGNNLEAWQQWADKFSEPAERLIEVSPTAVVAAADPLITDGQLNRVKQEIASLARLKITSAGFSLDEQVWREPFGEKSIADVNREVKETLEKYHLPQNLWQGDQLANLGDGAYPVAVFMSLETKIQSIKAPEGHYYRSSNSYAGNPNPSFDVAGLSFALQTRTDPNQQQMMAQRRGQAVQPQVNQPEPLMNLQFTESVAPYRQLRIGEVAKDSSFYLGYFDPSADFMISLTGSPVDGWVFHQIWGEEFTILRADTANELMTGNQELFDDKFLPLLRELGVGIVDQRQASGEAATDDAAAGGQENP